MSNNIFDLSRIAGPSNDTETSVERVDEEKLLLGYQLLTSNEWKTISIGSSIRYLRKDGSFRKGGIVQGVWVSPDKSGKSIVKIDLSAGYNKYQNNWSITSDKIEKIWIKKLANTATSFAANEEINDLKEKIKLMEDIIAQLTKEMQRMHNEHTKMIQLIKKLHNIN
jgi:hypothetical protein